MTSRTTPRPRLAWLGGTALLTLGLSVAPSSASAHAGSNKRIRAELRETGASLHVEVDAVDAAVDLGLGLSIDPERLRPHTALVSSWLGQGLQVRAEGGPCLATTSAPVLSGDGDAATLAVDIDYACPAPLGVVRLQDDTVFDRDPDHETFVSIVHGDAVRAHVLRAGDRSVALGSTPSATQTASAFVVEGARHLVTGYDHLLFLLSLLLGAGLLVRRVGMRPALRDVAWVVTAFTLGHSVSLVAAALGWVVLPTAAVEIAIAASIVLVAIGNVVRPRAAVAQPWLAAAFGLVHGFGFSSVLAQLGLPTAHRVLALACFNVGIELAQLAFVLAVLWPLAQLAAFRGYQRFVLQGASLAIALCGCVWLLERSVGS